MLWLGLAGALAVTPQAPLVFSASAEIVYVAVSVTDSAGRPVRGLQARDFTVREDGKPREIAVAVPCSGPGGEALAECPVDFVLLMDTSTTMRADLTRARDVAVQFVNSIPATVRGRNIVSFSSSIQVWPFDQAGPAAILDQILTRNETGGTRFFDALLESMPRAAGDPTRRPIVVALTDGEDTGALNRLKHASDRAEFFKGIGVEEALDKQQSHPVSEIADKLRNASVTFYAISFASHLENGGRSGALRAAHGLDTLKTLAKATGGLVVDGSAPDLGREFARIGDDIAAQYVLGFVPAPSGSGKNHKLKVEVALAGAKVRHRLGYEARAPR